MAKQDESGQEQLVKDDKPQHMEAETLKSTKISSTEVIRAQAEKVFKSNSQSNLYQNPLMIANRPSV